MREAHSDWWAGYNDFDNTGFQTPASRLFSRADDSTGWRDAKYGTYHAARSGYFYLSTLTELIRTTGDPKAVEELTKWSKYIRDNMLGDWDGSGYEYIEYWNSFEETNRERYRMDDTIYLDETMLAGTISTFAYVLHKNRDCDASAGVEADFWFKYLDQNWVPKWLYRTTYGTGKDYKPDPSFGLKNAVNWNGPGTQAGSQSYGSPFSSKYNPSGISHQYPVRDIAHAYIMSMKMYYLMGEYFRETGVPVKGSWNKTHADYTKEAGVRHDFWLKKNEVQSDGSRDVRHQLAQSDSKLTINNYGPDTRWYAHYTNLVYNFMHWAGFKTFAQEQEMIGRAKIWYSGPGAQDVYDKGNIENQKRQSNGGGATVDFVMLTTSLLACFDETGEIAKLNEMAIRSPTSHKIGTYNWGRQHPIHHNGIISCELKNVAGK